MSTTTTAPAPVKSTRSTTAKVPTWVALKSQYQAAERSGRTARAKAYDTITRAFALTSETESGKDGVKARSARSRASEVIDGLAIESGNVFGLSAMRIAQVVNVYQATATAGLDPYSADGREIFTALDTIRKFDADALAKAAKAFKGATPEAKADVLAKAVEAAKAGDAKLTRQTLGRLSIHSVQQEQTYKAALYLARAGQAEEAVALAKSLSNFTQNQKALAKIAKGELDE